MNMFILNEHKIKYLNRRLTEIDELNSGLATGEFCIAATIGHRLKGNGETFGFPEISTLGMKLEKAAVSEDKEIVREAVDELKKIVNQKLSELNNMSNDHI